MTDDETDRLALVREALRLRDLVRRLEDGLGDIVQRIDENPNEECPFCEPEHHDAGADHEEECPVTAAHALLAEARKAAP